MKQKVVIADGNKEFCAALVAALEARDEFEVIGVAEDGAEAIQMVEDKHPDIFVLDLLLTKYDGLSVLKRIQNVQPHPVVLATSAFITDYVASAIFRLGVFYLQLKPCDVVALIERLEEARRDFNLRNSSRYKNDVCNIESLVTTTLHNIGVPAHIKGYQYLREAIIIAVEDMDVLNAVTRVLYAQVATNFQTTPKRVEQAIRRAIDIAWDRGDLDALQRYFGYTVSNTKGKPTNTEFISIIADQVRLWMQENGEKLK